MSTLAFRWSLESVVSGAGQPQIPARGLWTPQKVVSVAGTINLAGTYTIPMRTPTSPQPDPTVLWEWTEATGFPEIIIVEIAGTSGSLRVHSLFDEPNDEDNDDLSPAGTHERTNTADLSCWFPIPMMTTGQINPTLATAAGLDADDFPAIATSDGSGSGYLYKVWAVNPSTTDDVVVNVWAKG